MRYGDGGAFRQALEQRLKTRAGEDGARLARNRKRVAFDRLLARLAAVAPARSGSRWARAPAWTIR